MTDFADVSDDTEQRFKKVKFLKIIPGFPITIRILNKNAYKVYKHFLSKQFISVVCLGPEYCPICEHNRAIADANPGIEYKDLKGIISRQKRYLVNVLNRTVAKVSPSGKVIYAGFDGSFPNQDTETGEVLTNIEAKPLNTVEVLERGKELFTDLNTRNKMVVDQTTKQPVGIWNYDITLVGSGKGTAMKISVDTHPERNDVVELKPEDLFVLETVPMQLTPDEMRLALDGVSTRDIFAARRAQRDAETKDDFLTDTADEISKELKDEINSELDEIFNLGADE